MPATWSHRQAHCAGFIARDRSWGQVCVVHHRIAQEAHRLRRLLIRVHVREGDAGMVVNGHEQHLPTHACHAVLAVARDAVAGTHDAPQALGVDVQHLARGRVFIALHRLGGLQFAQPREAGTRQHAADRGCANAHALR